MPLHVQKQEPHRLSRLQLLQLGIFQSWQPVSTRKQHESHGHNHRFRQLPCAGLQMCCKRCKKTMLIQMARSRCHLEKRCPKNKVGFSRQREKALINSRHITFSKVRNSSQIQAAITLLPSTCRRSVRARLCIC